MAVAADAVPRGISAAQPPNATAPFAGDHQGRRVVLSNYLGTAITTFLEHFDRIGLTRRLLEGPAVVEQWAQEA